MYGIIYRIINIVNKKSYIGKTKSHYGKEKYGAERRFKQHLANSHIVSRKNECPLFYNAIQKYGKDSFKLEILLNCELSDVDEYEQKMINLYKSSNRKFGYNIALGGKGRKVVEISEEVREKISNSQSEEEMNIKKIYKNDEHIGYRIRRRENGKMYNKCFVTKKLDLDEKYRLAKEFLQNIKEYKNNFNPNPYNKKDNLPVGISKINNGYEARHKKYHKTFSKFDDKINFNYAVEWLENIKVNPLFISKYDDNTEEIDMKNLTFAKNKKGDITGYIVKIIKDKKTYKKGFERKELTMQEKYDYAIQWRNNILQPT